MNSDAPQTDAKLQVTQSDLEAYNNRLPAHLKAELWELEKVEVISNGYPIASRKPTIVIRDRNYFAKYSGNPDWKGFTSEEEWKSIFRAHSKAKDKK